ncbi:MAG: transcriptional regulator [Roseiflexus sp.]|nr:MAG: transcriptional regulator [Anaerolineae bacterium]GIW00729.1 MAG: transcriptional regulator [Roseiflexus sp.]
MFDAVEQTSKVMDIHEQAITDLLAQAEGERVVCVRANVRPIDLAQTMAAMANASGGTILIGVRGRQVEGVADVDAARAMAFDAALACLPPLVLPLPVVVTHNGATLLIVTVPSGLPHVYSVGGTYLRREGSANVPLAPDALRHLLIERGETSWDRMAPPDATLADLDAEKIAAYARRVGPIAEADPLAFLLRRGCLMQRSGTATGKTEFVPTNAGLLLFGVEIERWFPQAEVTLVRYQGREMSDAFLREDIRDTLPETARRAERWLIEHMRRGSRMIGLEREDWTQFPLGAVREALINALAHRDYTIRGDSIRVLLFSDRLECYSPGRLPGHVTLQNLVEERFSRNATLVQALADLGLIERLGYGIDRMLRQMADAGLPPPEFRETTAGFLVTLYGRTGDDRADAGGADVAAWRRMGLNERQIAALLFLAEHQRITNRDMQELAPDVSAETLRRDLVDLVERGLLLRVGDKRGAYYILK